MNWRLAVVGSIGAAVALGCGRDEIPGNYELDRSATASYRLAGSEKLSEKDRELRESDVRWLKYETAELTLGTDGSARLSRTLKTPDGDPIDKQHTGTWQGTRAKLLLTFPDRPSPRETCRHTFGALTCVTPKGVRTGYEKKL